MTHDEFNEFKNYWREVGVTYNVPFKERCSTLRVRSMKKILVCLIAVFINIYCSSQNIGLTNVKISDFRVGMTVEELFQVLEDRSHSCDTVLFYQWNEPLEKTDESKVASKYLRFSSVSIADLEGFLVAQISEQGVTESYQWYLNNPYQLYIPFKDTNNKTLFKRAMEAKSKDFPSVNELNVLLNHIKLTYGVPSEASDNSNHTIYQWRDKGIQLTFDKLRASICLGTRSDNKSSDSYCFNTSFDNGQSLPDSLMGMTKKSVRQSFNFRDSSILLSGHSYQIGVSNFSIGGIPGLIFLSFDERDNVLKSIMWSDRTKGKLVSPYAYMLSIPFIENWYGLLKFPEGNKLRFHNDIIGYINKTDYYIFWALESGSYLRLSILDKTAYPMPDFLN